MNYPLHFTQNTCSISDDWTYKGMQVVWMENDFVRIGILVDRGADIFEFTYKPANLDFLLRLPGKLRNVQRDFSQMRNTSNQFEDHYYGGWQEILPNSPSFTYRGASLGQHGEISLIPWKYSILENSPQKVSLKLWTRPVRVPVLIEKTLSLSHDSPRLQVEEKLSNVSGTHLDLMWGHHIAFGLPFLTEGVSVESNAQDMLAEKQMPHLRKFQAEKKTKWPNAFDLNGKIVDASKVPGREAPPYSELAYLSGFETQAYYALKNEQKNIGFAVQWDASVFKYLWYWQERYGMKDFPWWGKCYAVALEPWTSAWTDKPEEAIANGEWLKLEAGETLETKLSAGPFTGNFSTQ